MAFCWDLQPPTYFPAGNTNLTQAAFRRIASTLTRPFYRRRGQWRTMARAAAGLRCRLDFRTSLQHNGQRASSSHGLCFPPSRVDTSTSCSVRMGAAHSMALAYEPFVARLLLKRSLPATLASSLLARPSQDHLRPESESGRCPGTVWHRPMLSPWCATDMCKCLPAVASGRHDGGGDYHGTHGHWYS